MNTHDGEIDARNENILVWVDGALVPRAEAMVSVFDAGFLVGDGIWEGFRLRAGRWAFLEEHLDRLFEALRAIDLDMGMDRAGVRAALEATRAANGMEREAYARLMVTSGRMVRHLKRPTPSSDGATVVVIIEHPETVPDGAHGLRLVTVPQVRGLPMGQDPKLNSLSRLDSVLAGIQAARAGADDALMLDPQGFVNTASAANFFIVRRGRVWTSTGDYCLNGITRGKVIGLCRAHGIPVFERNFSLTDAYGADEAFLAGTHAAQVPVAELDGRRFGDGTAGPVTRRIQGLYRDLLANG
jgi:branched-chain amino acid aminotransferase